MHENRLESLVGKTLNGGSIGLLGQPDYSGC
jgi:hypothetical protein